MADQIIRLMGVKGGGTDQQGEIGFIDIDDAGERTIRMGMSHLDLPRLIAALEELDSAIARERSKNGKDQGGREIVAKLYTDFRVSVDRGLHKAILQFVEESGRSIYVSVSPTDIEEMVKRLNEGRQKLAHSSGAPKPN